MRERFQLLFIFSLENRRLLYKSNIVYKKEPSSVCLVLLRLMQEKINNPCKNK